MFSKEEIQKWIDGECRARETKPNVYSGPFLTYSDSWLKALEFAKTHTEKEVREEFEKASRGDLDSSMSEAGYYKALKMVLEEK